jgi:hypothetical protein
MHPGRVLAATLEGRDLQTVLRRPATLPVRHGLWTVNGAGRGRHTSDLQAETRPSRKGERSMKAAWQVFVDGPLDGRVVFETLRPTVAAVVPSEPSYLAPEFDATNPQAIEPEKILYYGHKARSPYGEFWVFTLYTETPDDQLAANAADAVATAQVAHWRPAGQAPDPPQGEA